MKTQFFKQTILLAASVFVIAISFAQNEVKKAGSSPTSSDGNVQLNITETGSANGRESFIDYTNGTARYRMKMVADKVTELYVDDKKIPSDSFYVYNNVIEKVREQIKKDKAQAEEDRKEAEKDREQAKLDMAQAARDKLQAEKDRQQAEKDREQANLDRNQAKKDQANAEANRQQVEKDRMQADLDRQQALKDRAQAEKDRQQAVLDRQQAEVDRKQAEEDRALVKSLLSDLEKEHLITNEKQVTNLVLTNDEFIINGKKQPDDVHARYKAKYLKKKGSTINFSSNQGAGIYINREGLK